MKHERLQIDFNFVITRSIIKPDPVSAPPIEFQYIHACYKTRYTYIYICVYISVSGAVDSTYATQRFLPVQIFDDGSKICRYLNEKFNAPADLTLASAYTLFKLRCITLSNSTGGGGEGIQNRCKSGG